MCPWLSPSASQTSTATCSDVAEAALLQLDAAAVGSLLSTLERLSRSSMMAFRRSAWPTMMRRNRSASAGSSLAPSSSVSAKPLIEVTGVLISCETLATKSRRMASSAAGGVTSFSTTIGTDALSPSSPLQASRRAVDRSVARVRRRATMSRPRPAGRSASDGGDRSPAARGCARPPGCCGPCASLGLDPEQAGGRGVDVMTRSWLSTASTPSTMLARMASRSLRLSVTVRICLVELAGHAVEARPPPRRTPRCARRGARGRSRRRRSARRRA